MQYRLDELAALATEIGLPATRVDANRLDITIQDDCVLAFCNMPGENDTLVGFNGTPWHSHGIVQFLTGPGTYVECDELAILVGIGTGELVVVTQLQDGKLRDRWIAHKREDLELRDMRSGEELRVLCLRVHQNRPRVEHAG